MQYIWLIWSLILIVIWLIIYLSLDSREKKREMLIVSLWTSLLGLTEPLFVPAYWAPPSLFNLALRTGFDIESLIFSFGIGGIAVIFYEQIFHRNYVVMSTMEQHSSRHKFHLWTILSAPIILIILLATTNLNPLHSAIIAMTIGGLATWYCRPDLKNKMITSAFIFLIIYFFYFLTLIAISPGYVEQVWNLKAISGILILGIPLEELLFALSFGFIWSSIYEHMMWKKIK
ncbi:MAG: lycopene cyclase domain-containing protein [Candidatus Paceibacterota bacterium]